MRIARWRRRMPWAVGAVAIGAFGYFVWPTPYRDVQLPDKLRNQEIAFCCFAARVNRFTSRVDVLAIDGWEPLSLNGDTTVERATAAMITAPSR